METSGLLNDRFSLTIKDALDLKTWIKSISRSAALATIEKTIEAFQEQIDVYCKLLKN
jgi:hypothetical protein